MHIRKTDARLLEYSAIDEDAALSSTPRLLAAV